MTHEEACSDAGADATARAAKPKAYITLLGRSVWALTNSYCAAIRERNYLPSRVCIITEEPYKGALDNAVRGVEVISAFFGSAPAISREVVAEGCFQDAGNRVSAAVKGLRADGYEVALDITPGRKALVAGSLLALMKIPTDHVFYLEISTLDGASKPYLMIPFQAQRLHDFIEDARGHA
ncbi:MAG TPA: hypothetical protein PKX17_05075 [Candidatus Methanomethylicus sp.]|nr:hypothetical protein [Candidatus Methanomethylicus sp.]